MRSAFVAMAALLVGCSASRAALEDPVSIRCKESGLRACGAVTEGIVQYADGQQEGRSKALRATAQDRPSEVRAFASSLPAVASSPEARAFARPLADLADALVREAARNESRTMTAMPWGYPTQAPPWGSPWAALAPASAPVQSEASGSGLHRALTADSDPARLDGGSVAIVPGTPHSACSEALPTCAKLVTGPFVVTDLHASCGRDLVVLTRAAGEIAPARWYVDASAGLAIHGARLIVREGEALFAGLPDSPGRRAAPGKDGPSCSVTWGGFHPYAPSAPETEQRPSPNPNDIGY